MSSRSEEPHALSDPRAAGSGESQFAMWQVLHVLLRRRRLLIGLPVLAVLAAAGLALFGRKYVSEGSFIPARQRSSRTDLANLAAQFGITVPTSQSASTPIDFYLALLESRALLTQVVLTNYRFPVAQGGRDTVGGNLLQIFRLGGDTSSTAVLDAVKRVRRGIKTTRDDPAGVVTISVAARWAALSELLNRRVLSLVDSFDVVILQGQAHNELLFVQGRMEQAQQELQNAEDLLQGFLDRNRQYQSSPALLFERDRLQRRVDLRQKVYLSLAQLFEQAKFNEQQDTPVLTVVDQPEGSAQRRPNVLLTLIVGGILGLLCGVVAAFGVEFVARQRQEAPAGVAELRSLWQEAVQGVSPWLARRRKRTG